MIELLPPELPRQPSQPSQPTKASAPRHDPSQHLPEFFSSLENSIAPLRRLTTGSTVGARGCAAAACHGGARPGVAAPQAGRGGEFQLWFENDPHARAARTMNGPRAVQILQQLRIMVDGEIVDHGKLENCLACHGTTRDVDRVTSAFGSEGIGCAACHGPDQNWIETHHKQHCRPVGVDDGLVSLDNLVTRARACAACHIGDRDRDMNHDIIAAGHPVLRFEFATYHQKLPKHWRDREQSDPHFESRLWLAGQIAAADASLSLLAGRLSGFTKMSTWPELSEYTCASCHHEMRLVDCEKDKLGDKPRRSGRAKHAGWNRAPLIRFMQFRAESGDATNADDEAISALERIEELLDEKTQPDQDEMAVAVRGAQKSLDRWVSTCGIDEASGFHTERLARVTQFLASRDQSAENWDAAAQFYLASVAARGAWGSGSQAKLATALRLRDALKFPPERSETSFPLDGDKQDRVSSEQLRQLIRSLAF